METFDLTQLSDIQLADLVAEGIEEQRRRAVDSGDVEAIAQEAFSVDFDPSGQARSPRVVGSLIVCPGSLTGSSKPGGSHDCVFMYATEAGDEGAWVFEHRQRLCDLIRHVTVKGREIQQSITILPATEAVKIQRIVSKARQGRHERQSISAWQLRAGELRPAAADPVSTTNSR